MFNIESKGFFARRRRVVADKKLSKADFERIADQIGASPFPARKVGFVAARQATREETIRTLWNDEETRNTAYPGDWIVTNMSPRKGVLRDKSGHTNTYVIRADTFARLYEPDSGETEFGPVYKPKGVVEAIHLSGGFDILAPWGKTQRSHDGYLLLNGTEVYGNDRETFEATYSAVR